MAKLSFLVGVGTGYVLGAKAGRERYDQIRRFYDHAKDDPRLQSLAGMAQARADAVVSSVRTRLGNEPAPRPTPPVAPPATPLRRPDGTNGVGSQT